MSRATRNYIDGQFRYADSYGKEKRWGFKITGQYKRADDWIADDPVAKKKELAEDYRQTFANPYIAAGRGYIDDIIEPRDTRARLINALEVFQNKRDENPPKKHGNIPL